MSGHEENPFELRAEAWNGLADRLGATPFDRPGWLAAWWRAFGTGVVRGYASGGVHPRAMIAMRRSRGRLLSLTNWHSATSGLLASDEASLADLTAAMLDERPSLLAFQFLPVDGWQTQALADQLQAAGYRVIVRPLAVQSFVTISGDFETFEAGISRNLRGDVRRRRRRLEEAGEVTLEITDGRERLASFLEEGFGVEGSGWKADAGTAITSSASTERFYGEVAAWAADEGMLRLCYLRLNGRCIAFQFNLVADGVLYDLKGGYDTAYDRYSPGKLLHSAMLRHSFEHRLRRYEFLGVAERYKLHWANGSRQTVTLRAFAPTASGRALLALERFGRPLALRARAALQQARSRVAPDAPLGRRPG